MISYADATQLLQQLSRQNQLGQKAHDVESVCILQAVGRVVAAPVFCPHQFPAFRTAAMDGFALSSSDTATASLDLPVRFKILGTITARAAREGLKTPQGFAWKIMTGAAMPDDCDACIKVEDAILPAAAPIADLESPFFKFANECSISRPVRSGEHVRQVGEDMSSGSLLFDRGHRIRAEDTILLATLGVQTISVCRKLRVALLSTGDELIDFSEVPLPGQVRNSSRVYLSIGLEQIGCQVIDLGTTCDESGAFRATISQAWNENFDLIISTGGISVGECDNVSLEAHSDDTEVLFQKVMIRPGKPVLLARHKSGSALLGLPGNPVASMVAFRFFAVPYLRSLLGQSSSQPFILPLGIEFTKKTAGTEFLKARRDSSGKVEPLSNQQASMLHPLVNANGWIELVDGPARVMHAGEPVRFHSFEVM